MSHGGHVAKKRTELHGYGDCHRRLYGLHDVHVSLLHVFRAQVGIGWDVIDVALNGIGSRALNLGGELRPSAKSRTVEAGDDGDAHRGFRFADVIEISLRAGVKFAGLREVSDGLGETLGAGFEVELEIRSLLAELLFEERVEDDSGCACIFEAADAVQITR